MGTNCDPHFIADLFPFCYERDFTKSLTKEKRYDMIGAFNSTSRYMERWRSGAVVRASDFGPRGPWFEPRPVHISLWP